MRRIVTALLSTITAVVLLFSYHTSTDSGSPSVVAGSVGGTAPRSTPEGSTDPDPLRHAVRPVRERPGRGRRRGCRRRRWRSRRAGADRRTASPAPKAQSSSTKTYTGDAVDTRWGPVQVQITVTGGKITAAAGRAVPERATAATPRSTATRCRCSTRRWCRPAERPDRHRLRRDRHLRRLPAVAAVGPGPGAPVSRRAWVEQVMGLPVSIHLRGPRAHDRRRRGGRGARLRRAPRGGRAVQHLASRTARCRGCAGARSVWRPATRSCARSPTSARRRGCGPPARSAPWLPDGAGDLRFDPTGLVKGWAADRAAAVLGGTRGTPSASTRGATSSSAAGTRRTATGAGGSASRTRATGPGSPRWSS